MRLQLDDTTGELRTASNLDIDRLESGELWRPDLLDYGDLNELAPSNTNMFLDPSQKSAKTKERWGASEFVRGQLRLAADNKVDFKAEPTLQDRLRADLRVTHEMFVNMGRAFRLASKTVL